MADEDYDKILRRAVAAAIASGPLVVSPLPGSDLLPLVGIWGSMIAAMAHKNDREIAADAARKIALAVGTGGLALIFNMKSFNWVVAKFPGIGTVIGTGSNCAVNAVFTVWLGLSFIDLFEQEDIDVTDIDYDIAFVTSAMRPGMYGGLLTRIRAFFVRWVKDTRNARRHKQLGSKA
jgi:uncharacterized protein (DUF697 family)